MTAENIIEFSPAWRDRLQRSSTGALRSNVYNAAIAIRATIPAIYFDQFRGSTMVSGDLPWRKGRETREWTDPDTIKLAEMLQGQDIQVSTDTTDTAVDLVAFERRRHPLREWLDDLEWDGVPRIDDWLTYYLGAERSEYTQAIGSRWLISAVARIMRPGCKADHILILEGSEGLRKSTAFKALAGEEYFSDALPSIDKPDVAMYLSGRWIIEMAELHAIRRSEMASINAFITRTTDILRKPYERRVNDTPRQCVFGGTVNPPFNLPDEDGARRFWFVPVTACDSDAIATDRAQIWAEAVNRFKAGAPWHLEDSELVQTARGEQEARKYKDEWGAVIDAFLDGDTETSVGKVLEYCLRIERSKWTQADQQRVARHLVRAGWKVKRTHNTKIYVR